MPFELFPIDSNMIGIPMRYGTPIALLLDHSSPTNSREFDKVRSAEGHVTRNSADAENGKTSAVTTGEKLADTRNG